MVVWLVVWWDWLVVGCWLLKLVGWLFVGWLLRRLVFWLFGWLVLVGWLTTSILDVSIEIPTHKDGLAASASSQC